MSNWICWTTETIVGIIMIITLSGIGKALGIYEDYPYHFLIGLMVGSYSESIAKGLINLLNSRGF